MQPKHLGKQSEVPSEPDRSILDPIPNPYPTHNYLVRFTCPEFTSLCRVTNQPDFAHIVIDYVPEHHLVESKSLKLYLGAYRNHKTFHEACTMAIGSDICIVAVPLWLRIGAYWYPRGGIPLDIFAQWGKLPEGVYVPDFGVPPYRGR